MAESSLLQSITACRVLAGAAVHTRLSQGEELLPVACMRLFAALSSSEAVGFGFLADCWLEAALSSLACRGAYNMAAHNI